MPLGLGTLESWNLARLRRTYQGIQGHTRAQTLERGTDAVRQQCLRLLQSPIPGIIYHFVSLICASALQPQSATSSVCTLIHSTTHFSVTSRLVRIALQSLHFTSPIIALGSSRARFTVCFARRGHGLVPSHLTSPLTRSKEKSTQRDWGTTFIDHRPQTTTRSHNPRNHVSLQLE